jgi:phage baseplate assembly protein gpV
MTGGRGTAGFAAAEADRRIANMLETGRVVAVDGAAATVRVMLGGVQTRPLPVIQQRAGAARFYALPSIGEQVLVAAPNGDWARAIVLGSYFQADHPAPTAEAGHLVIALGASRITVSDDAIRLECAGTSIALDAGGIQVSGETVSDSDVIGAGISLTTHVHGGVQTGPADTGAPK